MIYLSEEEAKNRLDSESNLINRLQISKLYPGGKGKDGNFTQIERVLAGSLAHISGGRETAKAIGMSEQQVSYIKNGHSGGDKLQDKIDHTLGKVRDKALGRLMVALDLITDEKIEKAKLSEISAVAVNMASIAEKTAPAAERALNNNIMVQVYVPKQYTSEEVYDAIEVDSGEAK